MAFQSPLNWQVPIVDEKGRPTSEFMKKWAVQVQINSNIPSISGILTVGGVNVQGTTAPNTGIYSPDGLNELGFSTNATLRMYLDADGLWSADAGGWMLQAGPASATHPTLVPDNDDPTTGIGAAAPGEVAIVVGGATVSNFTATGYDPSGIQGFPSDATLYLNGAGGWTDPRQMAINNQAADYTLVEGDQYVRISNAGANFVDVPTNAVEPIPVGSEIQVHQAGAGQTHFNFTAPVVVNTAFSFSLRAQHSNVTLVKVATDEWDLYGDLDPTTGNYRSTGSGRYRTSGGGRLRVTGH